MDPERPDDSNQNTAVIEEIHPGLISRDESLEAVNESRRDSPKSSQEIRLERYVKRKQSEDPIFKEPTIQKLIANGRKSNSKAAHVASEMLTTLLEGFGATVIIDHVRAPKLNLKPGGVIDGKKIKGDSGYGERSSFKEIWFTKENPQPFFGPDNDEAYIFAQHAAGYSIATVDFKTDNARLGTIIGKSICSAEETFHGNIGAFFALMDVLHLISIKTDVEHPLQNLFFFAVSLFDLQLDIPTHYQENLALVMEQSNGR